MEPPAVSPTSAIVIITGKGGSRPLLTALVLVSETDRLRYVAGMQATDVIADGGGI